MPRRVRDPYDVLGVGRQATDQEIRSAFRRAAAAHHPDRHPEDPRAHALFTEVNQAYQVLSDPQKRAAWDRYGAAAFTPGGRAPGATMPDFVDLGSIDGLFGDLLGALGIRAGDRGDIKKKLKLSFEEAAAGCTKTLTYERADVCEECRGDGAAEGSSVDTCGACGGRGKVRFQQALLPVAVERACSRCRGTGRLPRVPCPRCSGQGVAERTYSAELTIPPGIEDGATRLVERGGHRTRPERAPGDLEITVEVAPHAFFRREGDDVVCSVPITFVQAALGGEVEVPTLEGKARVRVPPSCQPGSVLKLKGKGIPHRLRGGRGDQRVQVVIEVPTRLTPKAVELLEQLGQELGEDVQPQTKSFLEKLKGWL